MYGVYKETILTVYETCKRLYCIQAYCFPTKIEQIHD